MPCPAATAEGDGGGVRSRRSSGRRERRPRSCPRCCPAAAPAETLAAATANVVRERAVEPSDICLQVGDSEGNLPLCTGAAADWQLETNASAFRDVHWENWSMPYGWPVQGIWSSDFDGAVISTVARSHSYKEVPVLVSADNYGRIRLYDYPSVSANAPDKCYRGHLDTSRGWCSATTIATASVSEATTAAYSYGRPTLWMRSERKALKTDVRTRALPGLRRT